MTNGFGMWHAVEEVRPIPVPTREVLPMITYEYRCPSCDRAELTTQPLGDTLESCFTRGCEDLPRRVWSATPLRKQIRDGR